MATGKRSALPARLKAVQQRFARWRTNRQGHSRIPEALWSSAVKVAGKYGVHRTARALHLDYMVLKRRVEASSPESPQDTSLPAFIELTSRELTGTSGCVVEIEHPHGSKMRIELRGVELPDLGTLVRSFGEERR
jgi:hypothetical protein